MKDAETKYIAYDKDALAIVDAVSRVWRVNLLGCKCFSVIIDPALLALTTFQSLNVYDDFLSQLKGVYFSYNYFSNENNGRMKRQLIEKSSDGLCRYHNQSCILRPTLALIKALLVEYHDNECQPNYRRLMASLLKRFW